MVWSKSKQGESDFQSYDIIIIKCSIFNKKYKKTRKTWFTQMDKIK